MKQQQHVEAKLSDVWQHRIQCFKMLKILPFCQKITTIQNYSSINNKRNNNNNILSLLGSLSSSFISTLSLSSDFCTYTTLPRSGGLLLFSAVGYNNNNNNNNAKLLTNFYSKQLCSHGTINCEYILFDEINFIFNFLLYYVTDQQLEK